MIRVVFSAVLLAAVGCQPDVEPESAPVVAEAAAPTAAPSPAAPSEGAEGVVVYVTEWCPYCRQAREYLDAEGVPYTAVDIEESEAAYAAYQEAGGTGGIPLVVIGETTMEGWSQEATEEALEGAGL